MCDKWLERGYYIQTFHTLSDTSLYQHKENICVNLEVEMFLIFFFLKVLYFLQHFIIYVLFYITLQHLILLTLSIATIRKCGSIENSPFMGSVVCT